MATATKPGLVCEVLPTQGKFNFANSQTTACTEKVRVWFPSQPPVTTDFDIVEKGHVPLLMSFIQMRNLRFSLQLNPESCTLEFPALGAKFEVEQSTARHLVLDLCWIQGIEPGSSRIIQSADVHWEFPSFASADALVNQAKEPKPDPNCPACLGRKDAKHIATCSKSRSPPDPDSGGVDLPQGSGPGQEPSSSSIQRQAPAQRITGKTTLQPGQARQQQPRAGGAEQLEQQQPHLLNLHHVQNRNRRNPRLAAYLPLSPNFTRD
jgi:hypothetical protein